jgi:hypothetical protein
VAFEPGSAKQVMCFVRKNDINNFTRHLFQNPSIDSEQACVSKYMKISQSSFYVYII